MKRKNILNSKFTVDCRNHSDKLRLQWPASITANVSKMTLTYKVQIDCKQNLLNG
jgi:hypothetical protein